MSSSQQKIDANRANGSLSQGPLTEATKKISSRNAVKHGFTGRTVRITPDEVERYDAHVIGFHEDFQPVGALERTLCQQLADIHWTLNQISVEQMNASAHLEDMFESLKFKRLDPITICNQTQPQYRVMHNLGIYEQRKRRAATLVENQLRAMQKERLDKMPKPAADLPNAAKPLETQEKTHAAAVSCYDGGFVRSIYDAAPAQPKPDLISATPAAPVPAFDEDLERRLAAADAELFAKLKK